MTDQTPSNPDAGSRPEAEFGFHAVPDRETPASFQPDSHDADSPDADSRAEGARNSTAESHAADAQPGSSDAAPLSRSRRRRRGRRGRGRSGGERESSSGAAPSDEFSNAGPSNSAPPDAEPSDAEPSNDEPQGDEPQGDEPQDDDRPRHEPRTSSEDGPVEPPLFDGEDLLPPPESGETAAPESFGRRPRRRRGRGRGRRGATGESPFAQAPGDLGDESPRPDPSALELPSEDDRAPLADPNAPAQASSTPDASAPAREGRRRRRRRGRGRGADSQQLDAPADALEAPRSELNSATDDSTALADHDERRRRRRGRRGGRRRKRKGDLQREPVAVEVIPGDDDEYFQTQPEVDLPELPDDAHLVSPPVAAPQRKRVERDEDDEVEEIQPSTAPRRKNVILVNASDPEEVRVAVVEGGELVDFQMTAKRHKSFVNDIYRGKVVNLEPAIGAAFVDFGEGRNGFLHTSDVLSVYGDPEWSLEKLLTTKVDPEEWGGDSSSSHDGAEFGEHDESREHSHDHGGDHDQAHEHGHGSDAAHDHDHDHERADTAAQAESSAGEREAPAPVRASAPAARDSQRRGRSKRMRARPRLPITELLKKGDTVVVQVTKDAIGDKGPTLTTYISIPGRYLVLMPSMERTGVSRKIEDEKERRRLKKILQQLDIPPGMGVIVRTAGVGCSKADIKRDLDYLMLLWDSFGKRLTLGRGPAPLYEESDVAIRTIRDLFTPATESVIVDDRRVYDRVREFTEKLMPENVERIKLLEGPKPLFHAYNIEQEFERLFARRIDLPSGGSIVFDQAEALVAIDVNSGKTRTDGFDFEDIALKTNLDAVPEIARQIRLRDLGGIIVIDFIDMQRNSSRRQIERTFRNAMSEDRARSKLGRISQFGLLELTRQRLGPGLVKMIFTNCPRCRGSGRVRTIESRAQAILRRLGAALALKGFTKVEVRTQPEVVDHLKKHCADRLRDLEQRHEREIALSGVPEQVEDSVLRYLRADGREVRPGGRRKR